MKKISQLLSIIFHPIFSSIIIFNFGLNIGYNDHVFNHLNWTIILLIFTIFCPIILLVFFKKIKVIDSFELKTHKERVFPLLTSLLFILISFYLLEKSQAPVYVLISYLGGVVLIFSISIISYFYKISAHLSGIGGVYGSVLFYSVLFNSSCNLTLLSILLIAIIVALARLELKAHNIPQLVLGFLLGNIVMFLLNFIFYV